MPRSAVAVLDLPGRAVAAAVVAAAVEPSDAAAGRPARVLIQPDRRGGHLGHDPTHQPIRQHTQLPHVPHPHSESVGRHTTASVVQSIFLVILFDALFAIFFMELDV